MPTVDLGYRPRDQFISFHERRERWSCLVAHRRAGKTVACVADLIDAALRCTKPSPRFAYIAPLFVQAKDVAWGYVKRMTRDIPGTQFNEAELRVDLPGDRRIRLYGADNYDRLRGIYLDGVILDEYADMPLRRGVRYCDRRLRIVRVGRCSSARRRAATPFGKCSNGRRSIRTGLAAS